MHRFIPSLLVSLALTACVATPQIAPPAAAPTFEPLVFFSGRTLGIGRLKKIMSASEQTTVHGTGHVENDTLVLEQTVEEGRNPIKQRTWHIRRDVDGRYSGSLTDAIGPITGEAEGNRLHLAFTMKGGLPTEQWITLAADGRSAHNIMIVTKLGLRVAVLDEEIRKTD